MMKSETGWDDSALSFCPSSTFPAEMLVEIRPKGLAQM